MSSLVKCLFRSSGPFFDWVLYFTGIELRELHEYFGDTPQLCSGETEGHCKHHWRMLEHLQWLKHMGIATAWVSMHLPVKSHLGSRVSCKGIVPGGVSPSEELVLGCDTPDFW